MKKTAIILAAIALASFAWSALTPDTFTLTWTRTENSAYADTNNIYMTGVTYRMTNCQALISSTATQDLTGLNVSVRVGDAGTNVLYPCTVYAGTNGLFGCDFQFPPWTVGPNRGVTGQSGIELTVADTNAGVSVTYKARKLYTVTQPLH